MQLTKKRVRQKLNHMQRIGKFELWCSDQCRRYVIYSVPTHGFLLLTFFLPTFSPYGALEISELTFKLNKFKFSKAPYEKAYPCIRLVCKIYPPKAVTNFIIGATSLVILFFNFRHSSSREQNKQIGSRNSGKCPGARRFQLNIPNGAIRRAG